MPPKDTTKPTTAKSSAPVNKRRSGRATASSVEVAKNTGAYEKPEYGSDAVVDLLKGFGFKYAFLNPGSSYRGLQDSIVNYGGNEDPKVILGLHEDVVTAMAQGYATASGRPALCILHNLVGLMHGVMGIFNIYCSGMPVLILGGSGPSDISLRGPVDYLHSANTQGELVRSFVKWDDEATTVEGVLDSVLRGYKIANTSPKGPVYIALDSGLQEQSLDASIDLPNVSLPRFQPPAPPAASDEIVEQVAKILIDASYPLIVGGRIGFLPSATGPVRQLVELLGAAYSEDRSFVSMPTLHPQNLSGSRKAMTNADAVLAIDCPDVHWTVGGYMGRRSNTYKKQEVKARQIIDLSLNESSNHRWSRVGGPIADTAVQIMADPMTGLGQIIQAVAKRVEREPELAARFARRSREIAAEKAELRKIQQTKLKQRWDESPISPGRMVSELWTAVRDKPWYLTLRNHRSWPEGIWEFDGAGQYAGHSSGGGLGHGTGASVGAAFACRDDGRFPVGIIGDGDFLMATGSIWTAVHYEVPLLMVINNNTSWYNDEEHQFKIAKARGRPPENAYIGTTTREPDVDIVRVSAGYGAHAEGPIVDPLELAGAFKRAVDVVEKGGVAVVDVRTGNL